MFERLGFMMSERFGFIMSERLDSCCLRDWDSLCLSDWILDVWEIWILDLLEILTLYQLVFELYLSLCVFQTRNEWTRISSAVYSYSLLPRSSLRPLRGSAIHSSAASPVHSYGCYARLFLFIFYRLAHIILTDYRLAFLSVNRNQSHNQLSLIYLHTT
jgi:hypothetical protein